MQTFSLDTGHLGCFYGQQAITTQVTLSMIIRTEAIVLRSIPFRETSRIVTLFTRERGKMSVLAKGARRMKSAFGSSLQPMSYTQIVFYHRSSRNLQVLSESTHIRLFHDIGRSIEKLSVGLRIMELTTFLLQEEEPDAEIFHLILDVLTLLDRTDGQVQKLLHYFQLHLAACMGFAPHFDREMVRKLPNSGGALSFDTGYIGLSDMASSCKRVASRDALYAFAVFARAEPSAVMQWEIVPAVMQEVSDLIEDYMRYHVEGAYPMRSEKIFRQLQRPQ